MADNLEIKVSSSKGTPIIIQEAGPLDVNVQSSPKENMKMSKEELRLQILSSVAGAKGDSMYDIAVKHGYTGTEEEFINEFMQGGSGNGFYNLDNEHPLSWETYSLETAVAVVSSDTSITDETKNGMIITFWDGGEWKTYRYKLFYDPAQPSDFANVDNWEEFKGSGGGGEGSTRIVLRRITPNIITKVGEQVRLQFYFDHVDENNQSTGNSGTAVITVVRGGVTTKSVTKIVSAGNNVIDVTDWCGIGINNIRVVVTVDTGIIRQSSALAWTVTEVNLELSSTLNGYTLVNEGETLEVTYTLESGSNDSKSVVCYVDGVQISSQSQSQSISNGTFNISTSGMAHGQHTVQLQASQPTGQLDDNDNEILIYSNLIYAVVGVKTTAGTATISTMLLNIPEAVAFTAGQPILFSYDQYSTISIGYGSWASVTPTTVELSDGGTIIQSAENNGRPAEFIVRITTVGSHAFVLTAGTSSISFNISANAVDLGVATPSGRTLYLDAIEHGHSNDNVNRNTWTNTENGVQTSTTFNNFTWSGDGWVDGFLRVKGAATAVIGFKPLQSNQSGGMTAGFRFRISKVADSSERLISCVDSNGTGFYVDGENIAIVRNNTVQTTMKITEDELYDVAFVAFPQSGSSSYAAKNARFVYIYIDGIMSGCMRLEPGSSIFQNVPVDITIGNVAGVATIDIKRVWGYRRALSDSEVLNCYILDLDDDIEKLMRKVDDNNILNSQGGVTPDSLPNGTRIMIITGTATGTAEYGEEASVIAAAHRNKKSDYFPCTEISSYIKGATDLSKNFIARNNGSDIVKGQDMSLKLRLQGTSSIAYPVKNYRIYTKKSTMYVGNNPESVFGETGTLASGGKFAMHDNSAPVAVWCLKADYAESSSSHNTGMACLVNDTLNAVNVKTPAQRDVDTTEYPYEVRTTIDGEPCILFYRETLSDTPIFLGKFNFNNDKSTEAVFGFTGITGYHDVAPLDDIDNQETEFVAQQYKNATGDDLGVDLTECWEYKNNEDPMGSFLDDDFLSTVTDPESGDVSPKWLGTFEARYPDEDELNEKFEDGSIVPHYLSTLVSWVKSTGVLETDTTEQAETKLSKFRNELPLYFDIEWLCCYFAFTQIMACLDQMVKNMMMGFWYDKNADGSSPMGKVRAYMIFYDNDTILGVINNGRLLAPYNVTRQTVQRYVDDNPIYFYAGHESVLWNNLASQYPTEIRNAYVKLRGYLTNSRIFQYFDVQQTDKFCERIYNLDSLNKYVAPVEMSEDAANQYRDLMQGNRKSHRHFFVGKRLSILDNEWRAGEYYTQNNEISFKGISAAESSIAFVLRQAGNVEVQSDVSDDFVRNYPVSTNTETRITKHTVSETGTIFHVYGMRQLTKLDVSEWDIDQFNMGDFPYLEEFVFGSKLRSDGETTNPFTKPAFINGLNIGDKMPSLKKFIAQNLTALPSANLSGCSMIEEIDLNYSKSIDRVSIPVGAPLKKYVLPTADVADGTGYAPFNLSLVGFHDLDYWDSEEETGLNVGVLSNIQVFKFNNCIHIDGFDLLHDIATASGSILNAVDVTLPSAQSGSIQTLIDIIGCWNGRTGSESNLNIYGSYTVNDNSLLKSQCISIGYDPSGAATQMSSKIYGLMITIDQSTISEIVLQSYDPTNTSTYNPVMCIAFERKNYGSYIDVNDKTKGWYMTSAQARDINSIGDMFKDLKTIQDTNGICGSVGQSFSNTILDFSKFTTITILVERSFRYNNNLEKLVLPPNITDIMLYCVYETKITSIIIPSTVTKIDNGAFENNSLLSSIIVESITPPTLDGSNWFKGSSANLKIYVPLQSIDAYKASAGWSSYASIIEAIPSE